MLKEILEETCGFEFAKVYRFNGAARSIPVRLKRDGSEDLELEMPVPAEHAVKVTDAATVCGCALLALLRLITFLAGDRSFILGFLE